MRKTVLIVGDLMMSQNKFEPSLNRFLTYKERINKRNIGVVCITYDDLGAGRLPNLNTKRVDVMLFFPYTHWNQEIECYGKDGRIYGDLNFGKDFNDYFKKIDRALTRKYKHNILKYVNPPLSCIIDRDKLATYQKLKAARIESPPIFNVKKVSGVHRLLASGKSLFIKPRFGAMGKGITYINNKSCYTNFLVKDNKIFNRSYDYNWRAVKVPVSKQKVFLETLIKKGFIFQEAIYTPVVDGRKFDMRIYVIYGKVPYLYAKSTESKKFITNWSQGGRIEKGNFLKRAIGQKNIKKATAMAIKAAKILRLNYAGVDVIFDEKSDTLHVLEIQSFPGYERGFKLMKFLADTI